MVRILHLALLSTLAAAPCACHRQAQAPEFRSFGGPTMGSTYHIKYVGNQPVSDVKAMVERELTLYERTFSNWRQDSEIATFNRRRSTAPFPASVPFLGAVRLALELAERTDGAFDPTVKPLSDVYRAAKQHPDRPLDEAALHEAQQRVGFRHVHLAGGAVVKDRDDVELDLDGIVAGLCADHLAARMAELGIRDFMLDVTGEVLCRGAKAAEQPWQIGIVDPRSEDDNETPVIDLALRDEALCTSGTYRNSFTAGGKKWHHIFDPRTGTSADAGVVSVSVRAKSCALADGLATAFMVLGPDAADAVLGRWPDATLGAYFLMAGGNGKLVARRVRWSE